MALSGVESLAGAFHPHAIEVQDFSFYALVIDVRSQRDFDEDHIPGAVRLTPDVLAAAALVAGLESPCTARVVAQESGAVQPDLPAELAALVAGLKLDQAILVYCGRGGQDSSPVARALRWRGWTVDVLLGGWINYRRWVQAGMEVLPRLVAFRVVATSLGGEAHRVLQALAATGHQVLDIEALVGWRRGSLGPPTTPQPSQAWFESQLLQALRRLDPRCPVWVGDIDRRVGSLELPGALGDAIELAPTAVLQAPLPERLRRWCEDELMWTTSPLDAIEAVASSKPAPDRRLPARWHQLLKVGLLDLMASLLRDHFDRQCAKRVAERLARPNLLPPLVTDSLEPQGLIEAVKAWMPAPAVARG